MSYETIEIEKVERTCPACEEYARKHTASPPKIAVMACEGSCAKGEVARLAANLIAHRLASDSTVRICLGGAFTKDAGQRDLIRKADKVIAIEGCFIDCSSRMMKGVLPDLQPAIIRADRLYEAKLPFGVDEVPHEMLVLHAGEVAKKVVQDHLINANASPCACNNPVGITAKAADGGARASPCCSSNTNTCSQPAENKSPSGCSVPQNGIRAAWDGKSSFTSRNAGGLEITLGGAGNTMTAVEGLMASLATCAGMSTIAKLQERGCKPESIETVVTGQRRSIAPTSFESIHVVFTLKGKLDDQVVAECATQAMTQVCTIATTLSKAVKLTWEHRITG